MIKLINFEALSSFFFGGNFGFNDYYLVDSLMMPPITTILGALRQEILLQKEILKVDKFGKYIIKTDLNKIKDLTGGFLFDNKEKRKLGLGKIEWISPPFISEWGSSLVNIWTIAPKNVQKDCEPGNPEVKINKIDILKYQSITNNNRQKRIAFQKDMDYKLGYEDCFCNQDFWNSYKNNSQSTIHDVKDKSEMFKIDPHVGIDIKKQEEAFYMKNSLRFIHPENKKYKYSILCELTEPEVIENNTVTLGGENSMFYMEITDPHSDEKFKEIVNTLSISREELIPGKMYIALSDSDLNIDALYSSAHVINAGFINSSRSLVSSIENSKDDVNDAKPNGIKKRNRKLKTAISKGLAPGTVIIPRNTIPVNETLAKIGYNRFFEMEVKNNV